MDSLNTFMNMPSTTGESWLVDDCRRIRSRGSHHPVGSVSLTFLLFFPPIPRTWAMKDTNQRGHIPE